MNPWLEHVARIATGLQDVRAQPRRRKQSPRFYRDLIKRQLDREGWYTSTTFKVPSRSPDDYQKGVLDLICWPPPDVDPDHPDDWHNPALQNRPPPVLVELDKTRVYLKTRNKLAAFAYPSSGRIVILTDAPNADVMQGIDIIVCLGANSDLSQESTEGGGQGAGVFFSPDDDIPF